jgi:CRISPR/Cas system-associated exonuclease Cas4 (RecB family)
VFNIVLGEVKIFVTMQHRGEIVERAIRQSGYPISAIAKKLGRSRRWMYLMFDNTQIDLETVMSIGNIIHHDFSDEIKELSSISNHSFEDPENPYNNQTKEYWKNKYLKLLEDYNELLKRTNEK